MARTIFIHRLRRGDRMGTRVMGEAREAFAVRGIAAERYAIVYARMALGAAFLSGIASRFGLWGKGVGYGNFASFERYTAQVNAFMPASTTPFLAWSATAAELVLGVALVVGMRLRWAAAGSAALLALFGVAMAISFGIKEPLDYSVFSASAAALLLAIHPAGRASTANRLADR